MNGIINILKPPGMTSHDVVYFIRRKLSIKKVGHTGTLDPMATGVLPICIGGATRISEYMLSDDKAYRCELELGKTTDTQDIWGTVISESEVNVSEEQIREVFKKFIGEISQIPPKYSALKLNGKKLYEYAREGIEVEIKSRKITIYNLDIVSIEKNKIMFDVNCSKGTYVRTLCEDIGELLGCGGTMSFLVRTKSGKFNLKDTVTLETLEALSPDEIEKEYLLPIDYTLLDMKKMVVKEESHRKLLNGNRLTYDNFFEIDFELKEADLLRLYSGDQFIAIGQINLSEGTIITKKVFVRGA